MGPQSRSEAAAATRMILQGEATPAQIGAFMVPPDQTDLRVRSWQQECWTLTSNWDSAYKQLSLPNQFFVFGIPYDGRSRTAP